MFLLLAAAFALAQRTFDLARPAAEPMTREDVLPSAPVPPRGMDLRPAVPEMEMALLDPDVGPRLRIGALGGRHNAAPKLAHFAVGWRFQPPLEPVRRSG